MFRLGAHHMDVRARIELLQLRVAQHLECSAHPRVPGARTRPRELSRAANSNVVVARFHPVFEQAERLMHVPYDHRPVMWYPTLVCEPNVFFGIARYRVGHHGDSLRAARQNIDRPRLVFRPILIVHDGPALVRRPCAVIDQHQTIVPGQLNHPVKLAAELLAVCVAHAKRLAGELLKQPRRRDGSPEYDCLFHDFNTSDNRASDSAI